MTLILPRAFFATKWVFIIIVIGARSNSLVLAKLCTSMLARLSWRESGCIIVIVVIRSGKHILVSVDYAIRYLLVVVLLLLEVVMWW